MQRLEQGLLGCTCLTLWAGSVFNTHPRCEDGEGGTLGWCEFLSVVIGLADLVAGVVALLYFLHLKGVCTCLARCFGRVQAVRHRVVTNMRRRTMERRQVAMRQRTVDAPDARNVGNPVAEVEMPPRAPNAAGRDLALTDMHQNPRRNVDAEAAGALTESTPASSL